MRKAKIRSSYGVITKLGVFSSSLLVAAVAAYIYSPVKGTNAAEDTVETKVDVSPVVSLTLDTNNIDFTIVPTESGTFDSDSVVATVNTNSPTGYELYFSSEDNETAMTNIDDEVLDTITSNFNDTVTSSTMLANTWGYSLDNTDFSKIPALDNHVVIRNLDHRPANNEKANTVYIGTKIDTTLTAGTYTKNVKFSAIAHAVPAPPMQTFNPNTLSAGQSTVLRDTRDGNEYTVRKLADGKVWMTQNLRITNKTITSADSNVTSDFTIPVSNPSAFTDAIDNSAAYVDNTYGGHYNFYTATAGTGGTSLESGNAPSDICPKGWRMPTDAEFQTLYSSYNSSTLLQDEPGFVLSGYVLDGSSYTQGENGDYWSSTVDNSSYAYSLSLDVSNANAADGRNKHDGNSVRCVAI